MPNRCLRAAAAFASRGIRWSSFGSSLALTLTSVALLATACAKAPDRDTGLPIWPADAGNGGWGGAPGESPVSVNGKLSVSGIELRNEHGAPIQLRGPSSMWLNWETSGFARNQQGLKTMRDSWRASLVRAAMGVEPSGAYLSNKAKAFNDVRYVVEAAISLGMYVIIDWHDHAAHMHQAEAIEFFTLMAQTYGELPNVLYEVYNEPVQVDWATLKPYHEALVAAIRAVDPDNIIILGTPNWSQHVDVAARDPVAGTNLMYTLHFYSCTHTQSFRNRADAALVAGSALFVTEWGATHSDGGTVANPMLCLDEAQRWIDWMNSHLISWAAWKLDDCVDKSCFFVPGTSTAGDWPDSALNGHAPFVRDRMRE
jgi:endoglucanase